MVNLQKKSPVTKTGDADSRVLTLLGSVEEPLELPASDRMLQLPHRFRFNLPHAFARHLEDAAHFLERVRVPVAQTITQLDDLAFTIGQCLQHLFDLVL